MPNDSPHPGTSEAPAVSPRGKIVARPFFGVLDSIIVAGPGEFTFEGAIDRDVAAAIWTWMVRDLASDLLDPDMPDAAGVAALDAAVPELAKRSRDAQAAAGTSQKLDRRFRGQLGGEAGVKTLPVVLIALKNRPLLQQAIEFGRAANGVHEESALAMALQSIPQQDARVSALLMMAAVGYVAHPNRLVTAAIRLAGSASAPAITRAGFGPLVEALLIHAQSQLPALAQVGPFADVDLLCRSIDRFHRLVRAVSANIEMGRHDRWATMSAALATAVSQQLGPRLGTIAPDVNRALRRSRTGADRFDDDQVLTALNGVYLLRTIRDCRESLALNAPFEEAWNHVGQALEMHLQLNFEILRKTPEDANTVARVEAGIKMAELRFGPEYAGILSRARGNAERDGFAQAAAS